MSTLPVLLGRRAPVTELASFLDDAGPEGRVAALAALNRAEQQALYELAGPATLEDFVPEGTPSPVAHRGWNTLPLPAFGQWHSVRPRQPGPAAVHRTSA